MDDLHFWRQKKQNFASKKTAKEIDLELKQMDSSCEGLRDVRDGNKQEQTMRDLHFGGKNTNINFMKRALEKGFKFRHERWQEARTDGR